ncbi:hypothetical protein AAHE18_17G215400 [Arachis hypogaea]
MEKGGGSTWNEAKALRREGGLNRWLVNLERGIGKEGKWQGKSEKNGRPILALTFSKNPKMKASVVTWEATPTPLSLFLYSTMDSGLYASVFSHLQKKNKKEVSRLGSGLLALFE